MIIDFFLSLFCFPSAGRDEENRQLLVVVVLPIHLRRFVTNLDQWTFDCLFIRRFLSIEMKRRFFLRDMSRRERRASVNVDCLACQLIIYLSNMKADPIASIPM